MDLINQFIENYKKKLTFYENLGRISSSQLEDALHLQDQKSGTFKKQGAAQKYQTEHSL